MGVFCSQKINNNGNFDVRSIDFYKYLKKLGYPGKNTQLQLLCHNCNAEKEYKSLREDHMENNKASAEIYVQQQYNISVEENKLLWQQARELFKKIHLNQISSQIL